MALTNTNTFSKYTADGVQSLFSIVFSYQFDEEVKVFVDGGAAIEGLHYLLVDSNGNPVANAQATHIQFQVGYKPASGEVVVIKRVTEFTQEMDFIDSDPSSLELVEEGLDKVTQIVQELHRDITGGTDTLVTVKDIEDIQEAIEELQEDIKGINGDPSSTPPVTGSIPELINDLATEKYKISQILLNLSILTGRVTGVESSFTGTNHSIGLLTSALGGLNAAIASLQSIDIAHDARLLKIETFIGNEGSIEIENGAEIPIDITGLVFNKHNITNAIIDFAIFRKTDEGDRCSTGQVGVIYSPFTGQWRAEKMNEVIDYSGVTFSVTNTGQVQYTSTELSGIQYESSMKYRVKFFGV